MVADFAPLVRKTFRNDTINRWLAGFESETKWGITDNLHLNLALSFLFWLNQENDVEATLGVPEQNSRVTASIMLQGLFFNDRLKSGLGTTLASARSYNVRAGIPPQLLHLNLPFHTLIGGSLGYRLFSHFPLWSFTKLQFHLPLNQVSSPFPGAGQENCTFFIGFEYQED
jgi:hypothetical protein